MFNANTMNDIRIKFGTEKAPACLTASRIREAQNQLLPVLINSNFQTDALEVELLHKYRPDYCETFAMCLVINMLGLFRDRDQYSIGFLMPLGPSCVKSYPLLASKALVFMVYRPPAHCNASICGDISLTCSACIAFNLSTDKPPKCTGYSLFSFWHAGAAMSAKLSKKQRNTLQNPRNEQRSVMYLADFNLLTASVTLVAISSRLGHIT